MVQLELHTVLPNTRKDDIGALSVEDVYTLRGTDGFASYVRALSRHHHSSASLNRVLRTLGDYLAVMTKRSGRGRVACDGQRGGRRCSSPWCALPASRGAY